METKTLTFYFFGLLFITVSQVQSQNLINDGDFSITTEINNYEEELPSNVRCEILSNTRIGNSQPNNIYPKKFPDRLKLEVASQDELNFYLKKAKKTKRTGAILSIAGSSSLASGLLLGSYAWSGGTEATWGTALFLMFAGTGATVIGIPVLITGAKRVNRINSLRNSSSDSVYFEIVPCSFQDYHAGKQQYIVKLSLNF